MSETKPPVHAGYITLTPQQEKELLEFAWPHWISRDRFPEMNHLLNVLIARKASREAA